MRASRIDCHIRQVTVAQTMGWLTGAWRLFKKAPVSLMALLPLYILVNRVAGLGVLHRSLATLISWLAFMCLSYGGIAVIANLASSGTFKWGLLIDPLRRRPFAIAAFSLFSQLPIFFATLAAYLVIRKAGLDDAFRTLSSLYSDRRPAPEILEFLMDEVGRHQGSVLLIFTLLALGVTISVLFNTFGPIGIVLAGMGPFQAALISCQAMFSNFFPMLIPGFLIGVMVPVVLLLSLGLAMIILLPLGMVVQYLAFVDLVAVKQSPSPD